MRRRALLLAILVYVTLDLSLARMPGAFVFDPGDSVESVHINRGRPAPELAPLAAPAHQRLVASRSRSELRERLVAPSSAERRHPAVMAVLHRSSGDAAPASEDPY
jgi:hypothetical protein